MSDLLACRVVTHDGRDLGAVRDVRVVMDGPVRGALAAMRVDAIVAGGGAVAGRLGFLRGNVRGPAALVALFGHMERRAEVIAAGDIASWDLDRRRLVLRIGAQVGRDRDAPT